MTQRDRTVLMVLGVLAIIAASWMLVLKPKRDEVTKLDGQISAAQQRLSTATAAVASAKQAKAQYANDYATVAKLGKAVPLDDDVPSLVYQLENAADRSKVDFRSIALSSSGAATPAPANSTPASQAAAVTSVDNGSTGGTGTTTGTTTSSTATPAPTVASPAPATQTAAATLPPGASVGSAGFPTMPFDFTFTGRFFRLEDFLRELDSFTKLDANGAVTVRGRLMTVDAFSLSASQEDFPNMTAQIHATAYLLPRDQGLTGGATPAGPATGTAGTATTASSPTPVATAGVAR